MDCCNYVCQTRSSFYVKWLIRSISSEKLAGLLQPVINDGGQPCLTSTSRAQLSTGPPLCFPRGLSLIVYTKIVYKTQPSLIKTKPWNCSGSLQTKLPTGEEGLLYNLQTVLKILSALRSTCHLWNRVDVSSQPPSYEDKLPYEIWGWDVQHNLTWTLLLFLITIIKDYCL